MGETSVPNSMREVWLASQASETQHSSEFFAGGLGLVKWSGGTGQPAAVFDDARDALPDVPGHPSWPSSRARLRSCDSNQVCHAGQDVFGWIDAFLGAGGDAGQHEQGIHAGRMGADDICLGVVADIQSRLGRLADTVGGLVQQSDRRLANDHVRTAPDGLFERGDEDARARDQPAIRADVHPV